MVSSNAQKLRLKICVSKLVICSMSTKYTPFTENNLFYIHSQTLIAGMECDKLRYTNWNTSAFRVKLTGS